MALRRGKPLRPVSKKRQKENRVRKQVAHATFGQDPPCRRPGCNQPAWDCHEPLTRARGGSITDPENMVPLCRPCHDELGEEPPWAYDLGLLIHSWDALVDHPGTDRLLADLRKPAAAADAPAATAETTPNP